MNCTINSASNFSGLQAGISQISPAQLAAPVRKSTHSRPFICPILDGANVYLTSAELAAVGAILGKLPTPEEYLEYAQSLDSMSADIYRYLNFDEIADYQKNAAEGARIAAVEIQEVRA